MPPVAIIAVYFGRLPSYFDLWLTSCRFNPGFDWLVFTDCDWRAFDIPANVHMHALTLDEFRRVAADALGIPVRFGSPYKVCDFRPAYWMLLPLAGRPYAYWGHCDLDMIFGRLDRFIRADILDGAEKIFSVGHLTLYRNCPEANFMFRRHHPELNWVEILSDERHRGFDEHIGVNRIWRYHGGRTYVDETIIADLDPHVRRLEFVNALRNRRQQLFYFDQGKVLCGVYSGGRWSTSEYMYVHFQKRAMARRSCDPYASRFAIASDGFGGLAAVPPGKDLIREYNPTRLADLSKELPHRVRRLIRSVRGKIA